MIAIAEVRYEAEKLFISRKHKEESFNGKSFNGKNLNWEVKPRSRKVEAKCPIPVSASTKPQPAAIDFQINATNNVLVIFERLKRLLDEDDDLQPSQYAYSKAYSLLSEVIQAYEDVFPRAAVAAGEDEGIYIYWRKPGKSIELAIPSAANGRHTIYVRDRGGSYLIDRVSVGELVNWLYDFAKL